MIRTIDGHTPTLGRGVFLAETCAVMPSVARAVSCACSSVASAEAKSGLAFKAAPTN